MTIIKPPCDKMIATCDNCNAVITFNEHEITYPKDCTPFVTCPCCKQPIYANTEYIENAIGTDHFRYYFKQNPNYKNN